MKQALRAKYRQIRKEIPSLKRDEANAIISTKLAPIVHRSKCVAYYHALNEEVAIKPSGCCALPAITHDLLEFRIWDAISELVDGTYGKEPLSSTTVIPDAIILPCLSFDRKGHRLGYGKGFYDRTLSLESYKSTLKIGVAYSQQECEELPSEPHDIALDIIITELEIIYAKS